MLEIPAIISIAPAMWSSGEFFRAALWLLLKWEITSPKAKVIILSNTVRIKIMMPLKIDYCD